LWIGIVSWVVAIAQFAVYFPKGRLITNGIFSVSRNPIYSSWILLILPGLALVLNNWIFLLAAVVMLVAFLVCISDEEEQMRSHFGADYTDYCKKVRRLI
jgi:protein-S-isoprenylcysteine O-methyltransferase Ste14